MSEIWTEEELLNELDHWFARCGNDDALQQIKRCIREAFNIPTTSEREEELEKIIWKMQKELDKIAVRNKEV